MGVGGWRPEPVPILTAAMAQDELHQVGCCPRKISAISRRRAGAPAATVLQGGEHEGLYAGSPVAAAEQRAPHESPRPHRPPQLLRTCSPQNCPQAAILWLDEGQRDLVVSLRCVCEPAAAEKGSQQFPAA
jgi:hypothetical protein